MDSKQLEELAVFMEAEAEWSKQYGTPQLTQDYTDLARCAREVMLLRRVAVRAVMLLERLKSEAPKPRHSVLVNMACNKLQAAIDAVGLTEEAESGIK